MKRISESTWNSIKFFAVGELMVTLIFTVIYCIIGLAFDISSMYKTSILLIVANVFVVIVYAIVEIIKDIHKSRKEK